ncbi:MAG: WecB/TagA/CpsF family glycosyltransferase, partial [Planctomycetes bacterium]|nr:WecB/TagA/CpsF family glycosyltransferase [Planctomycetota bacterium]
MTQPQDILGIPVHFVGYEEVLSTIARWHNRQEQHYICLSNPHSIMQCRRDEEMRNASRNAGLVLPDGTGVVLAARLLGYRHQGRVTGPSLMLRVCDKGREPQLRHFFYGGEPRVILRLIEQLEKQFPGIEVAGGFSPPFRELTEKEDEEVVRRINEAQPDIVWVGLGAPKQEKWMASHVGKINAVAMIGVGAAFDFHSGSVHWAPPWLRKIGCEWAFRLIQDPKRLWKRNLDSFSFLALLMSQYIRKAGETKAALPDHDIASEEPQVTIETFNNCDKRIHIHPKPSETEPVPSNNAVR